MLLFLQLKKTGNSFMIAYANVKDNKTTFALVTKT